jgi:hypothetical protein
MIRHRSNLATFGLLVSLIAGCGDNLHASQDASEDGNPAIDARTDAPDATTPTVRSNLPVSGATGAAINGSASVVFSEALDRAPQYTMTVPLRTTVGAVPVAGTVVSTATTATFWPAARLASSTSYTATIAVGARSSAGVPLAAPHTWSFTTGTTTLPGPAVDLGTAGHFVLLAKSGVTNLPTSMVVGDVGVSPITSTAIVGFPLTMDVSNTFATTPQVTGRVYAPDFTQPTPIALTTAIGDMETAFVDAAGRAPDVTELGAGMIGTVTLAPGVYRWSSALVIPTNVTLSGTATDVWIFQIAQDLTLSSGTMIILAGGALPKNVFWQISGQLVVNTGAHLEGSVLTHTQATLDTGASIIGRLLAQTLVTIRGAAVTKPAP